MGEGWLWGARIAIGLLVLPGALLWGGKADWDARLDQGIDAIMEGHYGSAIELLKGVTDESKTPGVPPVRRTDGLLALATAYQYDGQPERAEQLFLECRNTLEKAGSVGRYRLALTYDNLGQLRLEQGRRREGEEFLSTAMGLYRQTQGEHDPHIANIKRLIGEVYLTEGRAQEAQTLLQESVETLRALPRHSPVTLAAALRSLANAHVFQGHYEIAEPLLQESLELNRPLGELHPALGDSLLALGHLYRLESATARAVPLLKRAMRAYENIDDFHLAGSLSELGMAVLQEGKFALAKDYLTRALEIEEKRFGPNHPAAASVQGELAEVYLAERNYAAADALIEQALATSRASFGPAHYSVGRLLMIAASIDAGQRHTKDADKHFRQALQIYRHSLAKDHPDRIRAEQLYANFTGSGRK